MLAQRTLAVRCVCGGARSQSAPAVAASGGSLDGAGPVVANGMVFVNSGYPRFGGTPGNVLLAFRVAR